MVVYAFILLTVGLLAYAALEPYLKPKIEVSSGLFAKVSMLTMC